MNNEQFEKKIYKFSQTEIIDIINKKQMQKLHEFNLIYPKQCKENTPYKICYEFLYKYINELNEDSFLFEILYLLSSNPTINKLFKNVSHFRLYLFSLPQIKQNLF